MIDLIMTTIEQKGPDGTLYKKQVAYVPPSFPYRRHIIEEKETQAVVLLTPGGQVEVGRTVPKTSRGKGEPIMAPAEYRLLRNPLDRMHGTRMTEDEAIEFSRKYFKPETHRITKAL